MSRELKPVPWEQALDTSGYPSFADFHRDRRAFLKTLAVPVVLAATGWVEPDEAAASPKTNNTRAHPAPKGKRGKKDGKSSPSGPPKPRRPPRPRPPGAQRPPKVHPIPRDTDSPAEGKVDKSCDGGHAKAPASPGKRDRPRTKGKVRRPVAPPPRPHHRLGGAPPPPKRPDKR